MLDGLNLDIPPGQRVLLVGPSGSGKSTLLRALAGLLETADSGERSGHVLVGGHDPQSRAGLVGLVLQEPGAGLVASSLARDVAFGPENVRMPRAAMHALVPTLLADLGLTMPPSTPTLALSGGETQRLALAGSLALSPQLLLLDEALAMLDAETADQVRAVVLDVVAARGLTLVVVEHRLGPWASHLDRLIALDAHGSLIADGPLPQVLDRHGQALADAGIWVPGAPTPTPVRVPAGVLGAPGNGGKGPAGHDRNSGTGPAGHDRIGTPAGHNRNSGTGPATNRGWPMVLESRGLTLSRTTTVNGLGMSSRVVAEIPAITVAAGEFTALVGASGSGEATALLALGDLTEPGDRIDIRRRGAVVGDLVPLELHRAWVPQWAGAALVAATVWDEITLTSRMLGASAEMHPRARLILEVLGLSHLADVDPRHLSGGEQRRVALAAAILHRPDLLLLDEPTVGQDRHTWAAIVGVVDAAQQAGCAVIAATHDEALEGRADNVVTLSAPPRAQVAPGARPLAARCGPLTLMAASASGVALGVLAEGWRNQLAVLLAVTLTGLVLQWAPGGGRAPTGRGSMVLTRLLPAALGALMVGWSIWLLAGHDMGQAVTAALRIAVLVVPSAFLLGYLDPDSLGDHLAQRLRLPARPVLAVDAALLRVGSFGVLLRDIRRARRVRGLDQGRGIRAGWASLTAITLTLLVRILNSAATLALAMDARGFAGAKRRTWFELAPWRGADSALMAVVGGWVALAAWLNLPS